MNFLPSQDRIAEECHAALIVEYIEQLGVQTNIDEADLAKFNTMVFQRDLPRERLQSLMHLLGTVLLQRPEESLREEGEKLLNAAHANRQFTEHSLPDSDTSTVIIEKVRKEFENSLVLEVQLPPEPETPYVVQPSGSDLEPSGIFSDEQEIPLPQPSTENLVSEEPPISIPVHQDPQLATIRRLQTTGTILVLDPRVSWPSPITFGELEGFEAKSFEHLNWEDTRAEIEKLLNSIEQFFREMHATVQNTPREKQYFEEILEKNSKTIKKMLRLETEVRELHEAFQTIIHVPAKRRKQFSDLEELEANLMDLESTTADLSYLQLRRLAFISAIKDVLEEQRQVPLEIKRIQKKLTEHSEELAALEIVFPEKW